MPALPRQELLRTAPASSPSAAGAATRRCSPRSSGATSSCSRRFATTSRWCSGSSTTSTTSSSSSTCSRSRTAEGAAPELIVVGSFPGRPSFAGLGELTASELETLWPSRGRATPAALAAATSAWAALRAPEPTALAEWATRDTPALPFLAPALRRLLEELPAPGDGLSGTERRALEAVAAGAHSPPAAFVAAQRLEEAPFLGDSWFYRALSALGQGTTRLLETDDGTPLPPPPPLSDSQRFARLPLRLTATGELTLSGEADRVELLAIDRWVGGTHITPDNTWRWDATELKLVRPR